MPVNGVGQTGLDDQPGQDGVVLTSGPGGFGRPRVTGPGGCEASWLIRG